MQFVQTSHKRHIAIFLSDRPEGRITLQKNRILSDLKPSHIIIMYFVRSIFILSPHTHLDAPQKQQCNTEQRKIKSPKTFYQRFIQSYE